jgi:hypothetical protein
MTSTIEYQYRPRHNVYPNAVSEPYVDSDIPTDSIIPRLRDLVAQVELQQRNFISNNPETSDKILRKTHQLLLSNILEIQVKKDAIDVLVNTVNEMLTDLEKKDK